MTERKKTPKEQADEMLERLIEGREVHGMFTQTFEKSLLISGEPMRHWRDIFYINIPTTDLTPGRCKELAMEIMDLHQQAAFFHNISSANAQGIKRGKDSTFIIEFAKICERHKDAGRKLPAAATMENLAKAYTDDKETSISFADIEVKFWKNILDHLATCRKLIENATLNISVELKALNQEKYLDRITSNGGQ